MGADGQLSLLDDLGPAKDPGGVTWISVNAPGKLGFASADVAPSELGAQVVLLLLADPAELAAQARERGIDPRAASASAVPSVAHLAAIAADLREGRGVVIVGARADAQRACAHALVEYGLDASAADSAVGGLAGDARAALQAWAKTRGR